MNDQTDEVTTGQQEPVPVALSASDVEDLIEDVPGGQAVRPATRRFLKELHDARRRGVRLLPAPRVSPEVPGLLHAPPTLVREMPDREPQPFHVVCKRDVTGATGVGVIAEGCRFSDGATVVRVLDSGIQSGPGWRFYDHPGTEDLLESDWGPSVVDVIWLDAGEPG